MEALTAEMQANIRKRSTERLRMYLIKAGRDEDEVMTWDRNTLMEEWALEIGKEEEEFKASPASPAETDYELQKRRLEFEIRKYEEQKEKEERERKEQKEKEERERKEQKEKDEKEKKERKEKEEREKKEKMEEQTIRNSLASRTKRYSDALKNVLWKFPSDPIEIPGFFDHLDGLFNVYEVDEDVRAKLLLANLSERAKALTMRLTKEQLNDYKFLKEFLLREFKISPSNLRARFWTMHKASDESFTIYSSKLRVALMYYLKSRKITDEFDKLVSLLVADRLKESLSKACLDYILAQEKEEWLSCEDIANAADIYVASHDGGSDLVYRSHPTPKYNNWTRSQPQVQVNNQTAQPKSFKPEVRGEAKIGAKMSQEEAKVKGLCFLCHQKGHRARECPTNRSYKKVGACMVGNPTEEVIDSFVEKVNMSHEISEQVRQGNLLDNLEPVRSETAVRVYNNSIDGLHERSYINVQIEDLPSQPALSDSGAEICCIDKKLIESLNLPVIKRINIIGFQGEGCKADVVYLQLKLANPAEGTANIAPSLCVMFAVVPELNERVILTPHIVDLLMDSSEYVVMAVGVDRSVQINEEVKEDNLEVNIKKDDPNESLQSDVKDEEVNESSQEQPVDDSDNFLDVESTEFKSDEGKADNDTLLREQQNCHNLMPCWQQAKQNKNNFFIDNNLLYHKGEIMGHKVNQLCLPEDRIGVVLRVAHDAPCAGHMAFKATRARIKLNFWFPRMDERIREYCASCQICQLRTPVKVADRVPITPIPRADELCFNHLNMDCIGPMVVTGESNKSKPKYNYALVLVDKFSRWPMAYPLRSLNAKGVCEALLQVFTTFSIPRIISSDCGTNFTSRLTKEFLQRMGCSPRFNTPGHPEAAGLVERCNQSLKTMIFKLAQSDPRGWHQLLPFVLWSLREKPSGTTHISPFTMVYGTLPRGPLSVLKESWAGERKLTLNLGKSPEEYLQSLKENLEFAKAYADYYSDIEMKRYADYYNLRSTDRKYEVGDKVAVLAPDFGSSKFYSRWQGPATVVKVKSPYSYIVEIEGKQRHLHANKIKRYHERLEQAMINSCSVIVDQDEEFGVVEVVDQEEREQMSPSKRIDPLIMAHLSEEEQKQLFEVLDRHSAVFVDKPGYCPVLEHEIKITPDFTPKRLKAYKVPELLKPEVQRQIEEMLSLGIIRPSKSEMASPVVCVLKGPKGQNGVRLAIDYRHVNKYSLGDCYPTPDIADVLQKVGRAKFISVFDAKSGYWQIPVRKEHQWLTAFVCDAGLFEFTRMPFGLKSASNTFIRAMTQVLHPVRSFTEPFVDDMAVVSMNWNDHLEHLEKFLQTVEETGLTLNLRKCNFAQNRIKFVGHIVGSGCIEPDPGKIATINDIQPPTTKKDVRRIMGFFSYFRNFIPALAEKARVITDLTRDNVPTKVPWEQKHQEALDKLKDDLSKATQLHTIDFTKEFGLSVDASATAVGCCLFQWTEEGQEKPIAFASLKLTDTQMHWSTIEREAFAVIWALKRFRSWIFLSKIIIYSDHNPLSYLTDASPKSAKLTRWALALQEFNVDFRYRPGRQNTVADFLSRL
jgi:transposase InsO family protein